MIFKTQIKNSGFLIRTILHYKWYVIMSVVLALVLTGAYGFVIDGRASSSATVRLSNAGQLYVDVAEAAEYLNSPAFLEESLRGPLKVEFISVPDDLRQLVKVSRVNSRTISIDIRHQDLELAETAMDLLLEAYMNEALAYYNEYTSLQESFLSRTRADIALLETMSLTLVEGLSFEEAPINLDYDLFAQLVKVQVQLSEARENEFFVASQLASSRPPALIDVSARSAGAKNVLNTLLIAAIMGLMLGIVIAVGMGVAVVSNHDVRHPK